MTTVETLLLQFPSDHQKTLLIDFEDDANRHAYVMGHNSLTEYWSRFPFKHRDRRNEMDNLPYHDFSLRVEGPLTIDINCDPLPFFSTLHAIVKIVANVVDPEIGGG